MAYQILDNGMPADTSPQGAMSRLPKGLGWDNSIFESKIQAYEYAHSWLGEIYSPFSGPVNIHNASAGYTIFDKPYDYNGSGDTIQVKEIVRNKE